MQQMRLPGLSVAAVFWLAVQTVNALAQGMGDELVLSRLGDPVEVEIEVRDWQQLDLTEVQVVNATAQQYAAFGLAYQPVLDTLSFNIVGPNLAGEVKILVSSRDPVAEPFLELLLALRWPEGSALREYVLLFDPPLPEPEQSALAATLAEAAPAQVVEPPVSEPVAAVDAEPAPEPAARESAGRREYRVQDGDTLQSIAGRFMAGAVADNVYQLLLALHQLNPAAFIEGNITLLRSDALLQIPSTRDMAAINPLSAQQIFDQRWLEGLRSQQQLPEPEPEPEQPAEPVMPPGTELASATPAPTAVQPVPAISAIDDSADEPPAAVVAAVVPVQPVSPVEIVPAESVTTGMEATPAEAAQVEAETDTNTALEQITSQAESIRNLLLVRQQRLAAVEQQILALRAQLQQAGTQAATLGKSMTEDSELIREAVLLGLVAALLLIALAYTVATAWRWAHEMSGYRR